MEECPANSPAAAGSAAAAVVAVVSEKDPDQAEEILLKPPIFPAAFVFDRFILPLYK
jgi:hypothetical protein